MADVENNWRNGPIFSGPLSRLPIFSAVEELVLHSKETGAIMLCHEVPPIQPVFLTTRLIDAQVARTRLAVAIHDFDAAKERETVLQETINAYRVSGHRWPAEPR
ncbi:hypothetical protein TYRP_023172 [Tyrophagus putrescentiae]|nr:hypothetical protein TYRP_023172 [Tyrophagus putrescentiae]